MKMTAKKTRVIRNSVIFLLVCALASLILSAVLFKTNPDRTGASASVEFTFKGAADGLGPNGLPFNMSGINTDEVIQKALETAGLSEKYTVEQIRDNLIVSGVYPENIIEQMTKYDSILNGNNNEQVKALDYHPTLYTVSLFNDFDTSIPEQQLKNLLSEILSGFRSWFNQVYSVSMTASEPLSDISAFDYTHQLTLIRESASQQQRFAQEMAQKEPAFRTEEACGQLEKGSGFDDAVALYTSLLDNDVSRAEAMVSLYALSKDGEQLKAIFENRIRTLNNELKEQTEEFSQLEKLVSDYVKDDILYVSTSGALQKVGSTASQTYDALVTRRTELTEEISQTKTEILRYEQQLADFSAKATQKQETVEAAAETATTETAAAGAKETGETKLLTEEEYKAYLELIEKRIASIQEKLSAASADFTAMLEAYNRKNLDEKAVSVSAVEYNTPKYFSGAFFKRVLKTAGPICALGLMVCLVYVIIVQAKSNKGTGRK